MPRLSAAAHIIGGIDQYVWIGQGVIPPALQGIRGGGWDYLTETIIAGSANGPQGWAIYYLDLSGAGPLARLSTAQVNAFNSGSGAWAAQQTLPFTIAVLGTFGTFNGAGLYTVGRDGILALKPDFNADTGIALWRGTSELAPLPGTVFQAYNDGLLAYSKNGQSWVVDTQTWQTRPAVSLIPSGGALCRYNNLAYRCYYYQGYTVVHPENTTQGWIVNSGDHDFNPDIIALPTGQLFVVTSYNAGERPTELRQYLIDPLSPTVDVAHLHPPTTDPPIPPTLPPTEPPTEPPTLPPTEPEPPMSYPTPKDRALFENLCAEAVHAVTGMAVDGPAGAWQGVHEACDKIDEFKLPWDAYCAMQGAFVRQSVPTMIVPDAQLRDLCQRAVVINTRCLQ